MRGKYLGPDFWRGVFTSWDRGVENVSLFCKAKGISRTIFYKRLKLWKGRNKTEAWGRIINLTKKEHLNKEEICRYIKEKIFRSGRNNLPSVDSLRQGLLEIGIQVSRSTVGNIRTKVRRNRFPKEKRL